MKLQNIPLHFSEMNIHSTYCENENSVHFKTNLISTAEFIKKIITYTFNLIISYFCHRGPNKLFISDNLMNRSEKVWKQIDTMRGIS